MSACRGQCASVACLIQKSISRFPLTPGTAECPYHEPSPGGNPVQVRALPRAPHLPLVFPLQWAQTSRMNGVARWILPAFLAASLAPAPRAALAAPPSTYFVDRTQAAADLVDWDLTDGAFTATVHRHFEDERGRRLLGIAEATYPPREALVARAVAWNFDVGSDSANAPLWWCDGRGLARVPYAVTAGALEHYLNLTERFRASTFWTAEQNLFWSNLVYDATITRRAEYIYEGGSIKDVYVAEMKLLWEYDDGVFLPVFLAHRVVVLSPEGRVIAVSGDGETYERVLLSSHNKPGGVREWVTR